MALSLGQGLGKGQRRNCRTNHRRLGRRDECELQGHVLLRPRRDQRDEGTRTPDREPARPKPRGNPRHDCQPGLLGPLRRRAGQQRPWDFEARGPGPQQIRRYEHLLCPFFPFPVSLGAVLLHRRNTVDSKKKKKKKKKALDAAKYHIRVNYLCPSWVDTPMVRRMLDKRPGARGDIERMTPMGPMAQPGEVADVAIFLSSPKSSYVTGVG